MKILLPVKRVPDPYAKLKPLADGSGIDTIGVKFEINPFDEIAIEAAVQLRDANDGQGELIVVSIGPSETEDQLRKALAMGADRAILIEATQALDPHAVAKELETVVRAESPDLVLMGKQATDDDYNQVGQILAARLGWSQAAFASRISLSDGRMLVTRETDAGEEELSLPLPCLVTSDLRLAEPRYIALPGIIKARNKPLERRSPATSLEPKVRLISVGPAPARPAGQIVGSVDELIDGLKGRGAL